MSNSIFFSSLSLLTQRQKMGVTLLALATLLANGLDIIAIGTLGAVTALALGSDSTFLGFLPSSLMGPDAVFVLLVAAALLFSVKTALVVFLARQREHFLARLQVAYSNEIAAYLFSGSLTLLKSHSKSDIEWAVLRSSSQAFGKILSQSLQFFSEFSLFIGVWLLFLFLDWRSGLLVSAYFIVMLLLFQLASRASVSASGKRFSRGNVSVGEAVGDMVSAFRELTVAGKTDFFLKRLQSSRADVARAEASLNYLAQLPRLLVEMGLIVGAIGFVIFQISLAGGELDLVLLSVFLVGSVRMMSALLPIQRAMTQLRFLSPQAAAAQDFVREARSNLKSVSAEGGGPVENWVSESGSGGIAVQAEGLSYSYSDTLEPQEALRGVSFAIPAGSSAAFIGPSGAGKSTLADLILGLDSPGGGTVTCDGAKPREILSRTPGALAYVPQKPGIVRGTLRENIALGVPEEEVDTAALSAAVALAGLEDLVASIPEGLDATLGEQSSGLSGGQLQRIGLARSLYSRPGLLVLDEATSALDPETEALVSRRLDGLRGTTTVITIAHRLATVQKADIVFLMVEGQIIARGSLRELMENSPLVKKYVTLSTVES